MTLPDIVSTAFTLFARYPREFLVLALPGALISLGLYALTALIADALGLQSVTGASSPRSNDALAGFGGLIAAFLVVMTFVVFGLLSDALVVPAAFDAQHGRRPSIAGALASWRATFRALAVLGLVMGARLGAMFASVILIPIAVWLFFRWAFVVQVACAEGGGNRAVLARSVALVRGAWWRVFLIVTALYLLASLPLIALQPLTAAAHNAVVTLAAVFAASWVVSPFAAIGRTLLYTDVRLRKGESGQPPRRVAV